MAQKKSPKDTPASVHLTEQDLLDESQAPEPFVFALSSSKRIVFPDLFDLPANEADEFLTEMEKYGKNDFKFLEKWLPEKDFKTYKEANLPLRAHARLMTRVLNYYRATLGDEGEDNASAGS